MNWGSFVLSCLVPFELRSIILQYVSLNKNIYICTIKINKSCFACEVCIGRNLYQYFHQCLDFWEEIYLQFNKSIQYYFLGRNRLTYIISASFKRYKILCIISVEYELWIMRREFCWENIIKKKKIFHKWTNYLEFWMNLRENWANSRQILFYITLVS